MEGKVYSKNVTNNLFTKDFRLAVVVPIRCSRNSPVKRRSFPVIIAHASAKAPRANSGNFSFPSIFPSLTQQPTLPLSPGLTLTHADQKGYAQQKQDKHPGTLVMCSCLWKGRRQKLQSKGATCRKGHLAERGNEVEAVTVVLAFKGQEPGCEDDVGSILSGVKLQRGLHLALALCSPAVTPLRCITCHLRTQTDRCRRGFGVCVAEKHETCMILKIFQDNILQLSYMVCQRFCRELTYNLNDRTYVHTCCNYNYSWFLPQSEDNDSEQQISPITGSGISSSQFLSSFATHLYSDLPSNEHNDYTNSPSSEYPSHFMVSRLVKGSHYEVSENYAKGVDGSIPEENHKRGLVHPRKLEWREQFDSHVGKGWRHSNWVKSESLGNRGKDSLRMRVRSLYGTCAYQTPGRPSGGKRRGRGKWLQPGSESRPPRCLATPQPPEQGREETDSPVVDGTFRTPLPKSSYLAVNRGLRVLSTPRGHLKATPRRFRVTRWSSAGGGPAESKPGVPGLLPPMGEGQEKIGTNRNVHLEDVHPLGQ
eukprot:bmy_08505T0